MNEKEKKIKEERTMEAMKKNLMGMNGKLGIILRTMGEPIIEHYDSTMSYGGVLFSDTDNRLPWHVDEPEPEEAIPTIEAYDELGNPVDEPTGFGWSDRPARKSVELNIQGWYFYNAKQGKTLEIKYHEENSLMDDPNYRPPKLLIVRYEGIEKFREIAGELFSFVPGEWEERVDALFEHAKKAYKVTQTKAKEANMIKAKKNKESFLADLKKLWGV